MIPNRLRIEAAIGTAIANWQWCAILAILGHSPRAVVPVDQRRRL